MTNEERERLMEFILQSQADSEIRLQKIAEENAQAAARMGSLESAFVGVFNMITETAKMQAETAKAQKELAEIQAKNEARLTRLEQAHAETGERLNVFINVLERYISERRNGSGKE